jgi:hypothetical protein
MLELRKLLQSVRINLSQGIINAVLDIVLYVPTKKIVIDSKSLGVRHEFLSFRPALSR